MSIFSSKAQAVFFILAAAVFPAEHWDYLPAADTSLQKGPAVPGPFGLVPLVRFSMDPEPAEGESKLQAELEKKIVEAFNRRFPGCPLNVVAGETFLKAGFTPEKLLAITAPAGLSSREYLKEKPEVKWADQPVSLEAASQIKILGQVQGCRYLLLMHDPFINFRVAKKPKDPAIYGSGTEDHLERGGEISFQWWDAGRGVLLLDDGVIVPGTDLPVLFGKLAEAFCQRISPYLPGKTGK
jgi:hypothetical protein